MDGNSGSSWGALFSLQGHVGGVFPHPLATCLVLSQILSNNIWFLVNQLTVSCGGLICVMRQLFLFAQATALSRHLGWVGLRTPQAAPVSILCALLGLVDQNPRNSIAPSVW